MERTRSATRRASSRLHMQVVIQQDSASGDQDPNVKNVVHVVIEDGDALDGAATEQAIQVEQQQENSLIGSEANDADVRIGNGENAVAPSARPYPCAFCASRFALKSSLRRHVRSQHANHPEREVMLRKAFECRLCHSEFTTNSDLWFHRQTVHGAGTGGRAAPNLRNASEGADGTTLVEDACAGDGEDENDLDDEAGFTCVLCTFTYRKVQDLKRHIRRRHPEALSKNGHDNVGRALASSLVTDNGDPMHSSEPVRICAITPANLHGDRVTRVPATTQLAVRCARSNGNTRRVVEELLQLDPVQEDDKILLTAEHCV
ncbi:hypothetical protein BIW11_06032 [Tropilaelaps mercedesae]|uniref:C2H2-type domain-containing protein n=1 Tax=Tropilaelaps mercedesae TaxID=418985 RepID=A0A1V9XZU0_9ACAR|nr:hypothetical protein BIW11_06032 [Tropilaelaps mercedesae]